MDFCTYHISTLPILPQLLRPPAVDPVTAALRPKAPILNRSALRPDERAGVFGYLVEKYPVSFTSALDVTLDFFYCWEVNLDDGVRVGFTFKDPHTGKIDRHQRFLYIQYVLRDKDSKVDALKALKGFLELLEEMAENPVQLVYYRYGDIRWDLIGVVEFETETARRLDPIYKRLFKRKRIVGTDYFSFDFQPCFPREISAIKHPQCNLMLNYLKLP